MSGDASGWVAAVAAVVAATVVTWQSWETRKAAQASRDAVVAANEALELSRQQAAESVRARIDAATPRISVVVPAEPTWPPLEPAHYLGDHPEPLPVGPMAEPMHMPRDKDRQILIRTPVTIINESESHLSVDAYEFIDETGATVPSPVSLEPQGQFSAWFGVTRPLEHWIEVYRAREAGVSGDIAIGAIRYGDPADTGAIDRWEIQLSGTPVEVVANLDGAWRLTPAPRAASGMPGAIGLNTVFRERLYYLSKRRNERLPD